jgi:hypothetical protein
LNDEWRHQDSGVFIFNTMEEKKKRIFVTQCVIDIMADNREEAETRIRKEINELITRLNFACKMMKETKTSYHCEDLVFAQVGMSQRNAPLAPIFLYGATFLLFKTKILE